MKKIIIIVSLILSFLLLLSVVILGAIQASIAEKNTITSIDEEWYGILQEAKQNVRVNLSIKNDIDTYALAILVKAIALAIDDPAIETQTELQVFIKEHFVTEEEIVHTVELEDGTQVEETQTIYLYWAMDESLSRLSHSPYNFPVDFLEELRELFVDNLGDGATPPYSPPEGQTRPEFSGTFPMPLNAKVTSGYGWRIHPVTGEPDFHTGIDISGVWHDNITSIADGTVVQVSSDQWYGNFILVYHPNEGIYSFYAHVSKQLVDVGDEVLQGNVIAIEGGQPNVDPNVGLSTGHHLHFGIYLTPSRSSHVNPTLYLQG